MCVYAIHILNFSLGPSGNANVVSVVFVGFKHPLQTYNSISCTKAKNGIVQIVGINIKTHIEQNNFGAEKYYNWFTDIISKEEKVAVTDQDTYFDLISPKRFLRFESNTSTFHC